MALFIDKLSFSSLLLALLHGAFFRKLYYVNEYAFLRKKKVAAWLERRGVMRLSYDRTTPGIGFEVHRQAAELANRVFSEWKEGSRLYAFLLRHFRLEDPSEIRKLECAAKHALAYSVYPRVKAWLLATDVVRRRSEESGVFIAGGALAGTVAGYLPAPALKLCGVSARFSLGVEKAQTVVFLLTFPLSILFRALKGWRDQGRLPEELERSYDVAYLPFGNLHRRRLYYDTVIYSPDRSSSLYPKNILHLYLGKVDACTRRFLNRNRIPFVQDVFSVRRIPMAGLGAFIREYAGALGDVRRAAPYAFVRVLGGVCRRLLHWNAFLKVLKVRAVYASYDHLVCKILAVALRKKRIPFISSSSTETGHSFIHFSYYNFDRLFVFGPAQSETYRGNHCGVDRYVVTGVTRSDIIHRRENGRRLPSRYRDLGDKHFLVLAFDEDPGDGFDGEGENNRIGCMVEYYETLIEIAARFPELHLTIKTKGDGRGEDYLSDPPFDALKERMVRSPRMNLERRIDTYRLIPHAGLILVPNASTVGVEALAAGKKVLYYELSANPKHPADRYGIVAYEREDLIRKVENVCRRGEYIPAERFAALRRDLCGSLYDGQARRRIREGITEVLRGAA